jgi:hypothetical protein
MVSDCGRLYVHIAGLKNNNSEKGVICGLTLCNAFDVESSLCIAVVNLEKLFRYSSIKNLNVIWLWIKNMKSLHILI